MECTITASPQVALALVSFAFASLVALPVSAATDDEFQNAMNTFQYQDYQGAKKLFQSLLYPNVRLEEVDQIRDAREYLGASEWFLGNEDGARQEFTSLLINWQNHELDPFYYPPALILFFENLRTELIKLKLIKEPTKPPPPEETGEGSAGDVYEKETIRITSSILPWVPFGVGQFANGNNSLGIVFLVGEVGLLSTAITSYYLIVNDAIDSEDKGASLYTTFWVSQSVFLVFAGIGIVEALAQHTGTTSEIERFEEGESSGVEKTRSWTPSVGFSKKDGFSFGLQSRF